MSEREIRVIIDYLAGVECTSIEFLAEVAKLHGIKDIFAKLTELEDGGFIAEDEDGYWHLC